MSIHSEHPFAVPPAQRDAARRFRGRLASPVTLWLTGQGAGRAGLTVSSVLVALGEASRVIGLIDPDTDLADALQATFTVTVLTPEDRVLAESFAGVGPAPGGLFRGTGFAETPWGPVLAAPRSWVGARVESVRELGWSREVVGAIEHVDVADTDPLVHLQGRYGRVQP